MRVILRQEALTKGLKRYFTGEPCRNGHISERYTSNKRCILCAITLSARYRKNHPDRIKTQQKEYYLTNSEDLKKKGKKHYAKDPEKHRAHKIEYYKNETNRLRRNEKRREWGVKNRKKEAEYARKYRIKNGQRRSRPLYTPSWVNDMDLWGIYDERDYLTKGTGIQHHVDHIIPLLGVTPEGHVVWGLHVPWNLEVVTAEENQTKHNKVPMERVLANGG